MSGASRWRNITWCSTLQNHDLRSSPLADPGDVSARTARLNPRAVFFGVLLDHVGTFSLGASFPVFASFLPPALDSDASLFLLAVAGLLCTALGGYVAARMAKRSGTLNGLAVGIVAVSVGILSQRGVGFAELPDWYPALVFALVVPAGALGGWLAGLRRIRA